MPKWSLVVSVLISFALGFQTNILKASSLEYCTRAKKLVFDPTEPMPQVGFFDYAIPKAIMGPDGIIDKYHMSPDGLNFVGHVRSGVKFAFSAEEVTAVDVANSIALFFHTRIDDTEDFGVKGMKGFKAKDLWGKSIDGIKLIDANTFELHFEFYSNKKMENLAGKILDLLYRKVPSRKATLYVSKPFKNGWDVASDFLLIRKKPYLTFLVYGNEVEVRTSKECSHNPDFAELRPDKVEAYSDSKGADAFPRMIILNVKKHSLAVRKRITKILRSSAIELAKEMPEIKLERSHFRPSEALQSELIDWDAYNEAVIPPLPKEMTVLLPRYLLEFKDFKVLKDILSKNFKLNGVNLKFELSEFPGRFINQDFGLYAFATAAGRQKWVEGVLPGLGLTNVLDGAIETLNSLEKCQANASATIPINEKDLLQLDLSTFKERSIVPLYREYSRVYTRRNLPIKFGYYDDLFPVFKVESK